MILYLIFFIINFPLYQNILLKYIYCDLFEEIHNIEKRFILNNLTKQFTKIMNYMIKTYANKKQDIITENEIKYLLANYDETIEWGKTFIQNIIVVYLLHYLRKYNRLKFFIKKIYNLYYNDQKIPETNLIDLKILLNDICDNKDWKKILDPKFVKLIINIYYNIILNDDNNILLIAKNQIIYSIIKISSIWTIFTIIESFNIDIINQNLLCIIFIMYLTFHMYIYKFKFNISFEYIGKLCGIIIGSFSYLYCKNYFILCFISESLYYLLLNSVMISIYKAIYAGITKFIYDNKKLSSYQINKIIVSSCACITIHYIIPYDISYIYEKINLFTVAISISIVYSSLNNLWNIIPFIIVFNIASQSIFNPFHIISSIPNIFIIMNYLESDLFINMIFKMSYLTNYKLSKGINYINSICNNINNTNNTNNTNTNTNTNTHTNNINNTNNTNTHNINNTNNTNTDMQTNMIRPIIIENFL
jgi:hypothetical protein